MQARKRSGFRAEIIAISRMGVGEVAIMIAMQLGRMSNPILVPRRRKAECLLNGYEQTISDLQPSVCFAPKSRHRKLDVCFSAENVCLVLNSRRKRGIGFWSAPDPERGSIARDASQLKWPCYAISCSGPFFLVISFSNIAYAGSVRFSGLAERHLTLRRRNMSAAVPSAVALPSARAPGEKPTSD
jgi:hypothetical protein